MKWTHFRRRRGVRILGRLRRHVSERPEKASGAADITEIADSHSIAGDTEIVFNVHPVSLPCRNQFMPSRQNNDDPVFQKAAQDIADCAARISFDAVGNLVAALPREPGCTQFSGVVSPPSSPSTPGSLQCGGLSGERRC